MTTQEHRRAGPAHASSSGTQPPSGGSRHDLSALVRGGTETPVGSHTLVPPPRARWRTRILLPGAVFAATGLALLYAAGTALWPATPVEVVPVLQRSGVVTEEPAGVTAADSGAPTVPSAGGATVQAPGWIEADPYSIAVTALADGIIAELLVLEGQSVSAGQVVARLVEDDARLALGRAVAELAAAEAQVASAAAQLAAAEADWEHPIELRRMLETAQAQYVQKQAELDRWPFELAQAEAEAEYAAAEYERVKPLHSAGRASDIELIRVQQAHAAQQAAVAMMQARRPILEAELQGLAAELRAAEENLRLRITDTRNVAEARALTAQAVAARDAAIVARDEAALRLERMEVRSPAAGIVMNRLKEPGSKLMLGGDEPRSAQVVRIYDPAKLQVRVDVPLVDAAKVGVGQPAEIVVDVLPERTFRGRVTRMVNEADISKNTLQVKVAIEQPAAELKPEMLARARFLSHGSVVGAPTLASAGPTVYAPLELLHRMGDDMAHAWVADVGRNVAVQRLVRLGAAQEDGWVAVVDGLHPGDRLIANLTGLRDGQRIRVTGEAALGRHGPDTGPRREHRPLGRH